MVVSSKEWWIFLAIKNIKIKQKNIYKNCVVPLFVPAGLCGAELAAHLTAHAGGGAGDGQEAVVADVAPVGGRAEVLGPVRQDQVAAHLEGLGHQEHDADHHELPDRHAPQVEPVVPPVDAALRFCFLRRQFSLFLVLLPAALPLLLLPVLHLLHLLLGAHLADVGGELLEGGVRVVHELLAGALLHDPAANQR